MFLVMILMFISFAIYLSSLNTRNTKFDSDRLHIDSVTYEYYIK